MRPVIRSFPGILRGFYQRYTVLPYTDKKHDTFPKITSAKCGKGPEGRCHILTWIFWVTGPLVLITCCAGAFYASLLFEGIGEQPVKLAQTWNHRHGTELLDIEWPLIIEPSEKLEAAKAMDPMPLFTLGIPSRPNELKKRKILRKTWAGVQNMLGLDIPVFFHLGAVSAREESTAHYYKLIPDASTLQQELYKEAREFGDIVQHAFPDAYRNLAYKSVALIRWTTKSYKFRYLMKIDADTFMNPRLLIGMLKDLDQADRGQKTAYGIITGGQPVIGDRLSRNFDNPAVIESSIYRPYACGPSWVMTDEAAKSIVPVSYRLPFYNNEDAFLGLCLSEAGATYKTFPVEANFWVREEETPCERMMYLVVHSIGNEEVERLWELYSDPVKYRACEEAMKKS